MNDHSRLEYVYLSNVYKFINFIIAKNVNVINYVLYLRIDSSWGERGTAKNSTRYEHIARMMQDGMHEKISLDDNRTQCQIELTIFNDAICDEYT